MARLINYDVIFEDNTTGAPVALGTVYFGEPNQDPLTNPKAPVDSDGVSISPTQSLTTAGKFVQDVYFVSGELYSYIVQDSDGVQVDEQESVPDTSVFSGTNINFDTIADAVASTSLALGNFVSVEDYATGHMSGVLFFEVVASGTGTADGGRYIDLPNTTPPLQLQANFPSQINIDYFGCAESVADNGPLINNAFAYVATLERKSLHASNKNYPVLSTFGRTTAAEGGTIQDFYGNGAQFQFTGVAAQGTTQICMEFFTDCPNLYDMRIFRDTVGADLWADLEPGVGAYDGTVGISAPQIRSKIWRNIDIEGFAFGVDQNIDTAINPDYRSSRCLFIDIDTSGCLTGWNSFVAGLPLPTTPFMTNMTWINYRYAGGSVRNAGVNTGTGFRGYNDGTSGPDQYPRALTFITPVIEVALYAFRMNANGKGNTLFAPYVENNTNNVFFDNPSGNPDEQWSVISDQDESNEVLTNPDYTVQQHNVFTAGRDVRIQSDRITVVNDRVNFGRTAPDTDNAGFTYDLTTGILQAIGGTTGSLQVGTEESSAALALIEFLRQSTSIGEIRVDASNNLVFRPLTGNLQISGLPTSSAGLASGTLWNNGGTPAIVP